MTQSIFSKLFPAVVLLSCCMPVPGVAAPNDAEFVSQSVPLTLAPGQSTVVSLVMKNTGTNTWTAAGNYKLGTQNPQDNGIWGANRVNLDTAELIAPGQQKTFALQITAPATPGVYNLQLRMVQEYIEWFGGYSGNVAVVVGSSDTVTYYHNDAAGTPLLATDAGGNLLWKANYLPYGDKLNNPAGSSDNGLWYAGKPYDSNTGLSYMGARYYDPLLGRFMGPDPRGFDPNNVHSFNRYAYANNNPYKFVDPDGNSPVHVAAFVIGSAINIGAQMYGPENRSLGQVDWMEAGISGAGAAITGGIAGRFAQMALQGTISSRIAIGATATAGMLTGGGGAALGSAMHDEPQSLVKIGIGVASGAAGAAIGAKVDNIAASTLQALGRSSSGVANHVAEASRTATNFGAAATVEVGTSITASAGKAGADMGTAVTAKSAETWMQRR